MFLVHVVLLKKTCSAVSALVSLAGRHFITCESLGSSPVKMSQAFHGPSICFNFLYRRVDTFKTPAMCLYLDSDIAPDVYNYFSGISHYFEPVSCWILFCENVAGVPRPFDQLPSRVGKVNTFKTPEMRLYFKFLTKINSKVR